MARILGIDYGIKRCGISATDVLQIIVSSLDTVPTNDLLDYLKKYLNKEDVEKIVIGKPMHSDGSSTYLQEYIDGFVSKLNMLFPDVNIDYQDERYTSIQAKEIILKSGVKKSKRRDKSLIDKVSAVLILQKYLNHI